MRHLVLTSIVVMGAAACTRGPRVVPVYDPASHQLTRIDYDHDGDGYVDARAFMANGRVDRLEADTNRDGRVDRWEYYRSDGSLDRIGGSRLHDGREDTWVYADGGAQRVEMSSHRNGRVDRRELYRDGALTSVELDANGDGVMDTWEQYAGGRLQAWMTDDNRGGGRPVRRLVYDTKGAARVELDRDGTGQFVPVASSGRDADHDR